MKCDLCDLQTLIITKMMQLYSFEIDRHEKHLLFLTYEEMKSDLAGVVSRVANFLGKTLSPKQVDQHLDQYLKYIFTASLSWSLGMIFIDKEAASADVDVTLLQIYISDGRSVGAPLFQKHESKLYREQRREFSNVWK